MPGVPAVQGDQRVGAEATLDPLADDPKVQTVIDALFALGLLHEGDTFGMVGTALDQFAEETGLEAPGGRLTPGVIMVLMAAWDARTGATAGAQDLFRGAIGEWIVASYLQGRTASGDPDHFAQVIDARQSALRDYIRLSNFGDLPTATALSPVADRFLSESLADEGGYHYDGPPLDEMAPEVAARILALAALGDLVPAEPDRRARWWRLAKAGLPEFQLLFAALAEAGRAPEVRDPDALYAQLPGSPYALQRLSVAPEDRARPDFWRATCEATLPDVSLTAGEGPARTGAPFRLIWTVAKGCTTGRALMVEVPAAARFSGDGYFVLGPGEPSPFADPFGSDRLRLVVPINFAQAGEIGILPYAPGAFQLRWALLDGSATAGPIDELVVEVETGSPVMVIQDPFPVDLPLARQVSPDGVHDLLVFADHYQVILHDTKELVWEAPGHDPAFSPTGRFLHAFASDNSEFELVDLVAGKLVFRTEPGLGATRGEYVIAVAWSPGDSFLALAHEAAQGISFLQPFIDRPSYHAAEGCGACAALGETSLAVMPENALAVIGMGYGSTALSLLDSRIPGDADYPVSRLMAHFDLPMKPTGPWEPVWTLNGVARFSYGSPDGDRPAIRFSQGTDPGPDPVEDGNADGETIGATEGTPAVSALGGAQKRSGIMLRSVGVAREDRVGARLASLGYDMAPVQPLRAGTVPFDEDYEFSTLSLIPASWGISGAARENLDRATAAWHEAAEICHVGRARGASVWSWQTDWGMQQFVQYVCFESTGYVPNGRAALFTVSGDRVATVSLGETDGDADYAEDDGTLADAEDWVAPADPALILPLNEPLFVSRPCAGKLALVSRDGRLVVLNEADATRAFEADIEDSDTVSGLRCLVGGKGYLQIGSDGRLYHYGPDGNQQLSGLYVDDEIVMLDSRLRFQSTLEGARYIHLRFPGDPTLHTLDQYAAALEVPDLVTRTLAGQAVPENVPLHPPPEVKIVRARQAGMSAELDLQVLAGEGGRLQVFRDGLRLSTADISKGQTSLRISIPLLPETRDLTLQIIDGSGARSAVASFRPERPAAPPQGRLFVIVVGTDIYADPGLSPLGYAVSDAQRLAETLGARPSAYYGSVAITEMLDRPDLGAALRAELERVASLATAADSLLISIAGHGILDGEALFLVTRETRLDAIADSALSAAAVAGWMARFPGRSFLFLDVCHAGAAAATGTGDAAVGQMVSRAETLTILSASKGRQFSNEGARWGGGAFTGALVRVLTGPRDQTDLDGNGVLDMDELYAQIKFSVVIDTLGAQTPWIAETSMPGQVPFF